ncbi:hypothetical protein, partial [Haloferax volcanii]|uniref:hypothetical protein n=1 Tax=Haloferax volcanii TaxID=2246 RepID=UPI001C9843A1
DTTTVRFPPNVCGVFKSGLEVEVGVREVPVVLFEFSGDGSESVESRYYVEFRDTTGDKFIAQLSVSRA